jgi:antitoxin ParD1/3/4
MSTPVFEKFSISLPPEMARIIHERVQTGEYASVSEVLREAMRAWLARERRLAALDGALAKGISELDAGLGEDAQTVREEVQAQVRAGRNTRS